jgi:cyclophilin family peptidyl-prolyl cis-trans isomerase
MPSDKRARQRAAREAKRLAEAKVARRRSLIRNSVIVVVLAVVVVGSVLLVTDHHSTAPTTGKTVTTGHVAAEQKAANAKAVAAGCPASTSTRVNTLTWTSPPPMTIDSSKTYKATVDTTAGTFVITLLAKAAPQTVNNFVFLADEGFYKCVTFHRVIPGFMDQTGDPTGTGKGGPGYEFANENVPKSYATGDVAMANSGGTDTNGSQFFILVPGGATTLNSDLAKGDSYSLFGKVSKGLTVVELINAEGSATGTPPDVTQRVLSVTISTS